MPVFVINPHQGLLVRGTIDLTRRPVIQNRNGTISTVKSVSWNIPFQGRPKGAEILVPQVVGDRIVGPRQALDIAKRTGQHLGIFDTPAHATAYAQSLHSWQANYYRTRIKPRIKR